MPYTYYEIRPLTLSMLCNPLLIFRSEMPQFPPFIPDVHYPDHIGLPYLILLLI